MKQTENKIQRKTNRYSFGKAIISAVLSLILCAGMTACNNDNESGSMTDTSSATSEVVSEAVSENASAADTSETTSEEVSDGHNHESNVDFLLDLKAVPSETEKGVINAVITLSHLHAELLAVQFQLTFSSNTVEGIYTTNEDMANTMTVVPTYTTTVGTKAPRYEQICTYNKASSLYSCMYVDLLQYPMAEEGQDFEGIKEEGGLVITIPFKVNADASVGSVVAFDFIQGSVSGTKDKTFTSAVGAGNSATYTLTENDLSK